MSLSAWIKTIFCLSLGRCPREVCLPDIRFPIWEINMGCRRKIRSSKRALSEEMCTACPIGGGGGRAPNLRGRGGGTHRISCHTRFSLYDIRYSRSHLSSEPSWQSSKLSQVNCLKTPSPHDAGFWQAEKRQSLFYYQNCISSKL